MVCNLDNTPDWTFIFLFPGFAGVTARLPICQSSPLADSIFIDSGCRRSSSGESGETNANAYTGVTAGISNWMLAALASMVIHISVGSVTAVDGIHPKNRISVVTWRADKRLHIREKSRRGRTTLIILEGKGKLMRKSKKRILNQVVAVALSVSMTTPAIAAPMADPLLGESDTVVKKELIIDDDDLGKLEVEGTDTSEDKVEKTDAADEENTEAKAEKTDSKSDEAPSSEKKDEEEKKDSDDELADIDIPAETEKTNPIKDGLTKLTKSVSGFVDGLVEKVTKKQSYPKFGTNDFILWWFDEASDEDKEAWYASISKYDEDADVATATNAKYPAFSSDEFDTWFYNHGVKSTVKEYEINGEKVEAPELNYSVLSNWIKYQSEEDAFGFIEGVLGNYYVLLADDSSANINTLSVVGDLWPETWGKNADYNDGNHGSGVQEDPFELDSVEDLRAFAKDVANGVYTNDDYYFVLKQGTYDLQGTWIPIGFNLNNGDDTYVPFRGHFAGQGKVTIKNLGFKASTALGVSSDLATAIRSQKYAGFFGSLAQATVNNIEIQTAGTMEVNSEMAGVLAGYAVDSTVRDVEINTSKIKGTTYVGGLIGKCESSSASADARDMILEDITIAKTAVYSNTAPTLASEGIDGHGAIGGVVGMASNTSVIDTTVATNTGNGNHIYGNKAFVGGVVGVSEQTDVLNSYVQNGEVGDAVAFAVGGIVGGYAGGAVKVARFSGTIRKPEVANNYSACFIGYRVNGAGFVYGENGDVAYLFADQKSKADTGICGTRIEDDGNYDMDAYIGYWHASDVYCHIISGDNQEVPEKRFYEILEDGILNAKLGTIGQAGGGCANTDTINHYTADKTGNPTRGYLLTIENPMVDGVQAAEITAYVNGSYKNAVTADALGAFAPGDTVYISFTDLSDGSAYYRLDDDTPGNPWYSYYKGSNLFYTYDNYDPNTDEPFVTGLTSNGGWVLKMPESDTVVSAKYEKVAQAVTASPQKVTFDVTQVRSGDRANPTTKWVVTAYDDKGSVITDYNGTVWNQIDPTNANTLKSDDVRFWIGSLVNGQVNTKFNLTWSTSNTASNNIITDTTPDNGLANARTAYINLNLYDSAINEKIDELVTKQHADGDKDSISTIEPYYYHSLVTAIADSADVDDKTNPPKGYCDITVKFNIKDETNTKIKGVSLNNNEMVYNVVRYLEGDRANPTERYTINGEDASSVTDINKLTAAFDPDYFTSDSVHWYISDEAGQKVGVESDFASNDDGTLNVALTGTGAKAYYNAAVTLKGMSKNSCNNSFIAGINASQDGQYTSQMMAVPDDTSTYEKYVKVTAKDSVNNSVTDTCHVVVNYKTVDGTEIMPTDVAINKKNNLSGYLIHYTFKGDSKSEITKRTIVKKDVANTKLTDGIGEQPTATVSPVYDVTKPEFTPYDNNVRWKLANADPLSDLDPYDVLNIDPYTGQIIVRGYDDSTSGNGYSPWVQSLIAQNELNSTTAKIRVIAESTRDHTLVDFQDIDVEFSASTISNEDTDLTYDLVYTKTIGSNVASKNILEAGTWSGTGSKFISSTATSGSEAPIFTLSDNTIAKIVQQSPAGLKTSAEIAPKTDAAWIDSIISGRKTGNSGTMATTLQSKTRNGSPISESPVTVNFRYDGVDLTAEVPTAVPEAYASGEYIPSMASVKDRDITMNVVATQGNFTIDNPGTRSWKYGIVKLSDTTYSAAGVKNDDATYTLTGDLANYAKVDENGYLVPIKGLWESEVISQDKTSGSVTGVVTASKDCSGVTVTDSYSVTINFRFDKTNLDQTEATFNVVYTEDSRTNSKLSHWTGDDAIKLKAIIHDESGESVTPVWESSDPSIVTVAGEGDHGETGKVSVNEDTWIKDIIDAARNDYNNDNHSGTRTVTVTAKHPTTGATADTCTFTVNFRYDQAILDRNEDVFNVIKTQTSRTLNPSAVWSGDDIRKLNAKMFVGPGKSNNVYWTSEDPSIVTVDDAGNIQPKIDADWMNEIIQNKRYSGQKKVAINADNDEKTIRDSDNVTVNFIYEDAEFDDNAKTLNVTITGSGSRYSPNYTIEGDLTGKVNAVLHSSDPAETKVVYSSANDSVLGVDANGNLTVKIPDDKNRSGANFTNNASAAFLEAIKHAWNSTNNYFTNWNVVVTAASEDGRMADQCTVTLKLKYIDNTYTPSSGGGGGGGSSSGGGGGATGVTTAGTKPANPATTPGYVVKGGQWSQDANGKWIYTNGRTFTNEWAAISNPYADTSKGQSLFDWFFFGKDSKMVTGWYTDEAGDTYYLNPLSDNTQGRMYTGWNWIDADGDGKSECYYFEKESTGKKGKLYKSTTTPDGYTVNEKGQWVQNGQVITRDALAVKNSLPAYVKVGGTWSKNSKGQWIYDNGHTYKNEWAAISNPYADTSKGQPAFSWFHFGPDGALTTGWFTDKGNAYYLNPVSDNTLGSMSKGWTWIDDNNDGTYECYYFEAANENELGRLRKSTKIGSYSVNEKGQWINALGKVETRTNKNAQTPAATNEKTENKNLPVSSSKGSKKTVEINGTKYVSVGGNVNLN